jgi:fumarylacetoacetase
MSCTPNDNNNILLCHGGGICRLCGQVMIDPTKLKRGSEYGLTRLINFKLGVVFVIGGHTNAKGVGGGGVGTIGRPMTAQEARGRIFGYVLMKRQLRVEVGIVGPLFTSKNFATTMSPWIVMATALEPYRCATSAGAEQRRDDGSGDPMSLEYLRNPNYGESSFVLLLAPLRTQSLLLHVIFQKE